MSYAFDPDSESDEESEAKNSSNASKDDIAVYSCNASKDDIATFSTSTSVSPQSSINRLKSLSTFNLSHTSVSLTTTATTATTTTTDLSLLPNSADSPNSLTNRFLSMFSNTSFDEQILDNCSCLNELTPNTNKRVSFFGRQFGVEDASLTTPSINNKYERQSKLQKSKSSFCLGINSDLIEEELICMSSPADTNTNVGRSSMSSQPLSVDAILKSSRTRKTGANIWASDQPVSDESNWMTTPKAAPRLKFSLPTTLEFVSLGQG